jgi:hypothetical protein
MFGSFEWVLLRCRCELEMLASEQAVYVPEAFNLQWRNKALHAMHVSTQNTRCTSMNPICSSVQSHRITT